MLILKHCHHDTTGSGCKPQYQAQRQEFTEEIDASQVRIVDTIQLLAKWSNVDSGYFAIYFASGSK
jgi:hypothetical protein